MTINIAPGVFDIIPNDPETWRSSFLWQYVEKVMRETAAQFGFQEIRTPIFERVELFKRVVGDSSDIVAKEMYAFEDKGGRMMALRPEGTAAVMRAFIENQLQNQSPIQKFFYICPMFRYDRPQAGRYRQHHQFGAEAIGSNTPEQDVELIDLLTTVYTRLGLQNLKVYINSIGEPDARAQFREALKAYLKPHFATLSEESQKRFEQNPLRILDSKDPTDQTIVANAPSILDFLSPESKAHFEKVQSYLKLLNIDFEVNPRLVRGLDYYNGTVFEVVAGDLGAQNSVGGGGRYDGLLKMLGGQDLPAIGFGCGIERTIQTMLKQNVTLPADQGVSLFIIPLGEEAQNECFTMTHYLRQQGISVQMDYSGRKLNKVMQYANTIKAKHVVVIGENELKTGEVDLKEMATGDVIRIPIKSLLNILKIERDSADFVRSWDEMNRPFDDPREAEYFKRKVEHAIKETQKITNKLKTSLESLKTFLDNV